MDSWSYLPEDIIEYIIKKIDMPTDLLNFAAVCKPWRLVAVQNYNHFPQTLPICLFFPKTCPLPMLLIPFNNGLNRRPYLYSITDKKPYNCFSVPVFRNKWMPGSTRGWLVTVDIKNKSINLLNPVTAKEISLPHLSTFDKPFEKSYHHEIDKWWYVQRATILFDASGKPENSVIVAVVSCSARICFCKVGDDKWRTIERSPIGIRNVINFEGKLYAVDLAARLFAIEIGSHQKWTLVAGPCLPLRSLGPELFLVESSKQILLIVRGVAADDDRTTHFRVFGLVKSASNYRSWYHLEDDRSYHRINNVRFEWVKLESIGEQMIFLGYNHSLSLDSRAYPGCRGNCIYFADNMFDQDVLRFSGKTKRRMPHDIGVYHLQDKRVEPLAGLGRLASHPALWFSPNCW